GGPGGRPRGRRGPDRGRGLRAAADTPPAGDSPQALTLTASACGASGRLPLLAVPAREDRRAVVEDGHRARVAVDLVLDEPALDDVDLLLRVLVHHGGDQRGQLDGVLLVLEELQLEGLLQALVRAVVELLALQGQGRDVVHDLAAEVVLAALGDVDLLL